MARPKPNPAAALSEAARRQLCLDLLAAAGAQSIRINDSSGEIVHGCLLSPGHDDQRAHPTASLNYKVLAGSCFGCGAAGGLAWFTAVLLRLDDAGAAAWLAGATGFDGESMSLENILAAIDEPFERAKARKRHELPRYSLDALAPYAWEHPYWTVDPPLGRGLHPKAPAHFKLGYDPATDRVVIPHFWNGELVGWQTRGWTPGAAGPKYLNTPGFPRKTTLFDLDRRCEQVVVVESVFSVLRHAHACGDFTATFGAEVTDEQIGAIVRSRKLRRVVLWPDADEAGWNAADGGRARSEGLIARFGRHTEVWVVDSPFAGDPADLDTPTALAVLERDTVPAVSWRRPEFLVCPRCYEPGHSGPCPVPVAGG